MYKRQPSNVVVRSRAAAARAAENQGGAPVSAGDVMIRSEPDGRAGRYMKRLGPDVSRTCWAPMMVAAPVIAPSAISPGISPSGIQATATGAVSEQARRAVA